MYMYVYIGSVKGLPLTPIYMPSEEFITIPLRVNTGDNFSIGAIDLFVLYDSSLCTAVNVVQSNNWLSGFFGAQTAVPGQIHFGGTPNPPIQGSAANIATVTFKILPDAVGKVIFFTGVIITLTSATSPPIAFCNELSVNCTLRKFIAGSIFVEVTSNSTITSKRNIALVDAFSIANEPNYTPNNTLTALKSVSVNHAGVKGNPNTRRLVEQCLPGKLQGDVNGDCKFDLNDIAVFQLTLGNTPVNPTSNLQYDFDFNGIFDFNDVQYLGYVYYSYLPFLQQPPSIFTDRMHSASSNISMYSVYYDKLSIIASFLTSCDPKALVCTHQPRQGYNTATGEKTFVLFYLHSNDPAIASVFAKSSVNFSIATPTGGLVLAQDVGNGSFVTNITIPELSSALEVSVIVFVTTFTNTSSAIRSHPYFGSKKISPHVPYMLKLLSLDERVNISAVSASISNNVEIHSGFLTYNIEHELYVANPARANDYISWLIPLVCVIVLMLVLIFVLVIRKRRRNLKENSQLPLIDMLDVLNSVEIVRYAPLFASLQLTSSDRSEFLCFAPQFSGGEATLFSRAVIESRITRLNSDIEEIHLIKFILVENHQIYVPFPLVTTTYLLCVSANNADVAQDEMTISVPVTFLKVKEQNTPDAYITSGDELSLWIEYTSDACEAILSYISNATESSRQVIDHSLWLNKYMPISPLESVLYSLRATNDLGLSSEALFNVHVYPLPTAQLKTKFESVVLGSVAIVTPSFSGGKAYLKKEIETGIFEILQTLEESDSDKEIKVTPNQDLNKNSIYCLIVVNPLNREVSSAKLEIRVHESDYACHDNENDDLPSLLKQQNRIAILTASKYNIFPGELISLTAEYLGGFAVLHVTSNDGKNTEEISLHSSFCATQSKQILPISPTSSTTYVLMITNSFGEHLSASVNIEVFNPTTNPNNNLSDMDTNQDDAVLPDDNVNFINPDLDLDFDIYGQVDVCVPLFDGPSVQLVETYDTIEFIAAVEPELAILLFADIVVTSTEIYAGTQVTLKLSYSKECYAILRQSCNTEERQITYTGEEITVTPLRTIVYTLQVVNNKQEGEIIERSVTVIVHPLPCLHLSGLSSITEGEYAKLTPVFDVEEVFLQDMNTDVPIRLLTSGEEILVNPKKTTTYTLSTPLKLCHNSGNTLVTSLFTVTVHSLPKAYLSCATNKAILLGDSVKLTANFSHGTGTLYENGAAVEHDTAQLLSSPIDIVVAPRINVTYSLIVKNPLGVEAISSVNIEVQPLPFAKLVVSNTDVNFGENVHITCIFFGGSATLTSLEHNIRKQRTDIAIKKSDQENVYTPSCTTTFTISVVNVYGTLVASDSITIHISRNTSAFLAIPHSSSILAFDKMLTIKNQMAKIKVVFSDGQASITGNYFVCRKINCDMPDRNDATCEVSSNAGFWHTHSYTDSNTILGNIITSGQIFEVQPPVTSKYTLHITRCSDPTIPTYTSTHESKSCIITVKIDLAAVGVRAGITTDIKYNDKGFYKLTAADIFALKSRAKEALSTSVMEEHNDDDGEDNGYTPEEPLVFLKNRTSGSVSLSVRLTLDKLPDAERNRLNVLYERPSFINLLFRESGFMQDSDEFLPGDEASFDA